MKPSIFDNMDGPNRDCAKWNKSDRKTHTISLICVT